MVLGGVVFSNLSLNSTITSPNKLTNKNLKPLIKSMSTDFRALLKVLSATFLLVCFLCLQESTCETRKNVFYFTSKALFVLEISNFNFSDIQMP